jgi:transcriptional regulator with XRE-family HTH domain
MKKHPIGERIKAFRLRHRWTQAQAAAVLGIGLRTLISFERGEERRPRPLTLAKIEFAMQQIEKAA